ncbi:hypothetical protein BV378_17490 [Nostoc sp. RF31YmG]|nr:hypothetical protein BV375_33680 [Nostoc sp. 106C]OUL24674.1 hypothetical protein BV378_17490 [Nostoc sp. RF31YmG]
MSAFFGQKTPRMLIFRLGLIFSEIITDLLACLSTFGVYSRYTVSFTKDCCHNLHLEVIP